MSDRVLILNEKLDKDLRVRLERDAKQRKMALNDCACAILCERYAIPYEESGQAYSKGPDRFRLKVPPELRNALAEDAGRGGGTIRGYALNILADRYGLPFTDPRRRPRRLRKA